MTTSQDGKCADKTGKTTEIRMGREVPIFKKASCCNSEKDAECADKTEKTRENLASSKV
jgi:hypothetical protein